MQGGNLRFTPGPGGHGSDGRTKDAEEARDQHRHAGEDGKDGKGDGFHHHEIHEHEDGFSSKHTHPDGHAEPGEHDTYEDAVQHMHANFGHEDQGRDDGDEPIGKGEDQEPVDLSGMYSRGD